MKYPVAVFSVIFPANIQYLDRFVSSLNNQTRQEFELVLVNDGVTDLEPRLEELRMPYNIVPIEGTPAAIRAQGMQLLKMRGFSAVVFADSDDTMSANRVEICCEYLQQYDIVCNDLDITDLQGDTIESAYWSSRLHEGFTFDASFLHDKNIAGLGNTSIRCAFLPDHLELPGELIAVDWFLFYQLLQTQKAVFTTKCKTLYRQHEMNTIGVKQVTEQRLRQIVRAKALHYKALEDAGYNVADDVKKTDDLEQLIGDSQKMSACLDLLNTNALNYFWWEESNYLI